MFLKAPQIKLICQMCTINACKVFKKKKKSRSIVVDLKSPTIAELGWGARTHKCFEFTRLLEAN